MNFITDKAKMRDLFHMTKGTFLKKYQYPGAEEDYEDTIKRLLHMGDKEQLYLQIQCVEPDIREENRQEFIDEIITSFTKHLEKKHLTLTPKGHKTISDEINETLKKWNI